MSFNESKKIELLDYLKKIYPNIDDLFCKYNEGIVEIGSSTPISEATISVDQINYVETLLDGNFLGFVTLNGLYFARYEIKD